VVARWMTVLPLPETGRHEVRVIKEGDSRKENLFVSSHGAFKTELCNPCTGCYQVVVSKCRKSCLSVGLLLVRCERKYVRFL
jgi:hypothetical protein